MDWDKVAQLQLEGWDQIEVRCVIASCCVTTSEGAQVKLAKSVF